MTRINIVPVEELYDQHLIAEYREITMVPASLARTLRSKKGLLLSNIPSRYTLNKGHVYFFYDKGKYLYKRYSEIIREMKARGFSPDSRRSFPKKIFIDNDLFNDWQPGMSDYRIIRSRINAKINQKPGWYKMTPRKVLD